MFKQLRHRCIAASTLLVLPWFALGVIGLTASQALADAGPSAWLPGLVCAVLWSLGTLVWLRFQNFVWDREVA